MQNMYGYSTNDFYSTSDSLSFSFTTGPPPLSADPNSPDMLNYNIRMALQRVNDIQTLARGALEKMYVNKCVDLSTVATSQHSFICKRTSLEPNSFF